MEGLNTRQQEFVNQLPLCDFNGAKAAERSGYSAKTAAAAASRLLRNVNIQKALSESAKARSERTKIDADWVLTRLAKEADADMADIYSDDGGLKPVSQWPKIWRQGLVTGIDSHQEYDYVDGEKIPAGVVQKIRISDRVKRLELIGKHVKVQAFADKVVGGVDVNHIMPVPSASSVEDWEQEAKAFNESSED